MVFSLLVPRLLLPIMDTEMEQDTVYLPKNFSLWPQFLSVLFPTAVDIAVFLIKSKQPASTLILGPT